MIYRIYLYKDETAISILKDFELYAKFYDIKDFEIYLNWLSKYAAKEGGYVFGQISNFNMGKLLFQIVEEEGKRLINDFPDIDLNRTYLILGKEKIQDITYSKSTSAPLSLEEAGKSVCTKTLASLDDYFNVDYIVSLAYGTVKSNYTGLLPAVREKLVGSF